MAAYKLEISNDTPEAEQFCAWLNAQGHDARVGNSTGNYVDGEWTSSSAEANSVMNALWDAYCNQ